MPKLTKWSELEARMSPAARAEVRRRVMIGTYVLSAGYYDAYYVRAQKIRSLIKRDFDQAFADGVDAVLTPATPSPAFAMGEKGSSDPVEMYLNDVFTVTVNMAGLPGLGPRSARRAALRLLQENQENGHHQTQTRRFTASVRQVSDGPLRFHRAGGHFGRFAQLSRGRRTGGDGGATEVGL